MDQICDHTARPRPAAQLLDAFFPDKRDRHIAARFSDTAQDKAHVNTFPFNKIKYKRRVFFEMTSNHTGRRLMLSPFRPSNVYCFIPLSSAPCAVYLSPFSFYSSLATALSAFSLFPFSLATWLSDSPSKPLSQPFFIASQPPSRLPENFPPLSLNPASRLRYRKRFAGQDGRRPFGHHRPCNLFIPEDIGGGFNGMREYRWTVPG